MLHSPTTTWVAPTVPDAVFARGKNLNLGVGPSRPHKGYV